MFSKKSSICQYFHEKIMILDFKDYNGAPTLLLRFTFYFKFVFSSFQNCDKVHSRNDFLQGLLMPLLMQNIIIRENVPFVKFIWGIFLQFVVLLKDKILSNLYEQSFCNLLFCWKTKYCNLFWLLYDVILEPGAWADFMQKTMNGFVFINDQSYRHNSKTES